VGENYFSTFEDEKSRDLAASYSPLNELWPRFIPERGRSEQWKL